MALDEQTAQEVINDIKEDGAEITINKIVAGVFDPLTGLTGNTTTPHPINAILSRYKSNELPNIVLAGDIKVLIGNEYPPTKDDTFIINGDTYNIEYIEIVHSKNSQVLFTCVARK
jgi:hypothetical protein